MEDGLVFFSEIFIEDIVDDGVEVVVEVGYVVGCKIKLVGDFVCYFFWNDSY